MRARTDERRAYEAKWKREHREKNPGAQAAYLREYRQKNLERVRMRENTWYHKNREACRDRARRIRIEMLQAYGGKCECCGESNPRFLTIDHIYGGGNKHRKEIYGEESYGGSGLMWWLRRNKYPKDKYQCLCANCNLAKGFYGICPHESMRNMYEAEVG